MMARKTDWFLITMMTLIIAVFDACGMVAADRAAAQVVQCSTDTECAEMFGGNGDPD